MAGSTGRASRPGRSGTARGCAARRSIIRSRSARSKPARTWDSLDAQLAAIDAELAEIADRLPWRDPVRWLRAFRGIGYRTALGLLAEIGDWRRFGHPRELAAYLGLVPSEYSSGDQRHRGHSSAR